MECLMATLFHPPTIFPPCESYCHNECIHIASPSVRCECVCHAPPSTLPAAAADVALELGKLRYERDRLLAGVLAIRDALRDAPAGAATTAYRDVLAFAEVLEGQP